MDSSFGKQAFVFDKRFWLLQDQTDINTNYSGNLSNWKLKGKGKSNHKKYKSKEKANCLKNTQNQRNSNNVRKTTCLKVWTLATNLTLILICVAILSNRVYKCIAR